MLTEEAVKCGKPDCNAKVNPSGTSWVCNPCHRSEGISACGAGYASPVTMERERREALAKQRASCLREGLDLFAYDNKVMRRYVDANDRNMNIALFTCESHSDAVMVVMEYEGS